MGNKHTLPQNKVIPYVKQFTEGRPIRDELLQRALDVWKVSGPICSGEGFYQHVGECWNDSSQMIILYTDGIKEFVQEQLLTGDLITMASKVAAFYRNETSLEFIYSKEVNTDDAISRFIIYLETLRARFVRHILNQASLEANRLRRHGPYRAKGTNAITSAVVGAVPILHLGIKEPHTVCAEGYESGYLAEMIIPPVLAVFGMERIIVPTFMQHKPFSAAEYLNKDISRVAAINFSIADEHSVCLYTCNGIDYFFDNQMGVISLPWRFMFQIDTSAQLFFVALYDRIMKEQYTYYPALYIKGTGKLIIPNPDAINTFITLHWDGVMEDKKSITVWGLGKYLAIAVLSASSAVILSYSPTYEHMAPGIAHRPPTFVGRGVYRRDYVPFDEAAAIASLQAAPIAPTNSKKGGMRRTRRARKGRSRKQRR